MPPDYEVGYKKPPRHSQFKRGQSGNPKGRPKRTRNLKTDLVAELNEPILVREGETTKKLSKQRAMLKSLMAKAVKGDQRAASTILDMTLRLLGDAVAPQPEAPVTPEEQEVLDALAARFVTVPSDQGI